MNLRRFLPNGISVEAVLGVLLAVSLGTLVIPLAGDAFRRHTVADVARKLTELDKAKQAYYAVHPSATEPVGASVLVPHYLDRWPCTMVGHCSDFQVQGMNRPTQFRGTTLDELEDPVSFQQASDQLKVQPYDFLFKQG
ncbi:MAG: hypothetical protein ABUL72_02315 [Armatimonadota bacterium]